LTFRKKVQRNSAKLKKIALSTNKKLYIFVEGKLRRTALPPRAGGRRPG